MELGRETVVLEPKDEKNEGQTLSADHAALVARVKEYSDQSLSLELSASERSNTSSSSSSSDSGSSSSSSSSGSSDSSESDSSYAQCDSDNRPEKEEPETMIESGGLYPPGTDELSDEDDAGVTVIEENHEN